MALVALIAWIAAVVIAAVLLGYCAYELVWKTKRLRTDLGELQALTGRLGELQRGIDDARQRLAATGIG